MLWKIRCVHNIIAKNSSLIAGTSARKVLLSKYVFFCSVKCLSYGVKIIFADRSHLSEWERKHIVRAIIPVHIS